MASPLVYAFEKSIDRLDKHLGEKLRTLRKQAGWSLQELANKVGMSHQQIHKYELGYTKITITLLYKFSEIFGVTPTYFFEGYKPPSSNTS